MLTLSRATASAAADAVTAALARGFLRIYAGERPASPDRGTSAPRLVELRFQSPAFDAAIDGVATARALATGVAQVTGTATWFRALESDGTSVVFDGSVGPRGADLLVSDPVIQRDAEVSVTRLTYSHPRGSE